MARGLTAGAGWALAVLASAIPAFAQTALGTRRAALVEAASARIEALRTEQRVPGITVAIRTSAHGDEAERVVWTQGFGLADLENHVPATERTIYRLASISKPITAVAVLQLVEAGKLDLDAPIDALVPELGDKARTMTTRQLLGHLAGVRHYAGSREVEANRHWTDVADALAIFAADPLLHEPGTAYRYTTYGYNVLGAIAQRVAERPFVELLHERVFTPAGASTLQLDDAHRIIEHRAQGYRLRDGELANAHPVDTSNKVPGGGLCGTALDLLQFGVAMLDDRLVTRATRDLMWTPMQTSDGKSTGYGCGFAVRQDDGKVPSVGHGGSQPRVQTALRMWPQSGVVVAVMCNLQGAKLDSLVDDLAAIAQQ